MVVYYELFGQKVGSHVVCSTFAGQRSISLRTSIHIARMRSGPLCLRSVDKAANNTVSQLSIATLSTMFVGTWMMTGGSKQKAAEKGPPINATSKDEENFIQYVTPCNAFRIWWLGGFT